MRNLSKPCLQAAAIGVMFGLLSVAYGQEHAALPLPTSEMDISNFLELGKMLGWPISFGYMAYKALEKLLKSFTIMQKDVRAIRKHFIKDDDDDLDV